MDSTLLRNESMPSSGKTHSLQKAAGGPTTTKRRARKVQALPRLQKGRPIRGPAPDTLVGYYLRRRIA